MIALLSKQATSWWRQLLLVVASTSLSLFAVEGGLRCWYPAPARLASVFSYRRPDPTLGWRLEPGTKITYETAEQKVEIGINSQGWRDAERDLRKPPGVYRIVVLGDSFMEAYSVSFEDMFSQRLSVELNRRLEGVDRSVEVINLGVGGFGTLQEYLAFIEYGLAYQPDLVLLGFYVANDAINNSRELESIVNPGFKAENRPFLMSGSGSEWRIEWPDYEKSMQRYERHVARVKLLEQVPWWQSLAELRAQRTKRRLRFWESTATYGLASMAMSGLQQLASTQRLIPSITKAPLEAWLGAHACTSSPAFVEAWHLTERILRRMAVSVAESGADFLVFSVPALHEVDASYADAVLAKVPDPTTICLHEAPGYVRLREILERLKIPYHCLLDAFRRQQAAGADLFWLGDLHWNERGHALAAEEISKQITERIALAADDRDTSGTLRTLEDSAEFALP